MGYLVEAQPITATEPPENPSGPLPTFVSPEFVPGVDQYLKRWMFVLVVAGVWTVAAVIGLALYEWWFRSVDKTGPVFVVMIYLVVGTVAALLVRHGAEQAAGLRTGDRADVGTAGIHRRGGRALRRLCLWVDRPLAPARRLLGWGRDSL